MLSYLTTSLFCLVFLATSGHAAAALPKLKIGAVLPLSGAQAPFGREALRGIETAQDLLKQKDAKFAEHVSVVPGDDKSSTHEVSKIAATLVTKERVQVLLGSLSGPATVALSEAARQHQRPLVSPFTTQATLPTDAGVFRSCFDEVMQGTIMADWAATHFKGKVGAILTDGSVQAGRIADAFQKQLEKRGGKLAVREVMPAPGIDPAEMLRKLGGAKPNFIFSTLGYADAASAMKLVKGAGIVAPFLGTEAWDTHELTRLAGASAEGSAFVTHYAVDDQDPVAQEFLTAFRAKYKRDPGVIAALAYDSFNFVVDALRRANNAQPDALLKALAKTNGLTGASGSLTTSETGAYSKTGIVKQVGKGSARFTARVLPQN